MTAYQTSHHTTKMTTTVFTSHYTTEILHNGDASGLHTAEAANFEETRRVFITCEHAIETTAAPWTLCVAIVSSFVTSHTVIQ